MVIMYASADDSSKQDRGVSIINELFNFKNVELIQQGYFNACLLQDILEFTPPSRYTKLKQSLKDKLPYVFASIVLPLSFLVLINFWTVYSMDRAIVDEHDMTATYFPQWMNHALHTIIVVIVLFEKLVVYRSYPTKLKGFAGVCSVIWAYVFTCAFLYFISGIWPYPLFGIMNNLQRTCYILSNCLLGFFVFIMGDKINRKIWGKQAQLESAKTGTKKGQ